MPVVLVAVFTMVNEWQLVSGKAYVTHTNANAIHWLYLLENRYR